MKKITCLIFIVISTFYIVGAAGTTPAYLIELTCLSKRSLSPGEIFKHSIKLLNGSSPVPNAIVKVNDPIGRVCISITTDNKGEAVWMRDIPAETKQQLYTFEIFYGDVKAYSNVSVTGTTDAAEIKSYTVNLGTTTSPDNATRVFASRGGFSTNLQTMEMTVREVAKFGQAVVVDYLSNPVNKVKAGAMIVSCTASIPYKEVKPICKVLFKMVRDDLKEKMIVMLSKGLVASTNISPEAKRILQSFIDMGDSYYAVAQLDPAEGLSSLDALAAAYDFVQNFSAELVYIKGKLKGASFPAQLKGSDKVYLMCVYHDDGKDTTKKPVIQPVPASTTAAVSASLPAEIRKLFFEGPSKFNGFPWFALPDESDLQRFNEISNNPVVPAKPQSSFPSTGFVMHESNDIDAVDKYIMSFLVKSGYIEIKSRTQTFGSQATTYNFLFYSTGFKNYVRRFNIQERFQTVNRPYVMLAHRNLVSIDYKNEYEDAPAGMKRTFYSIVFSYNLIPDIPGLPIEPKVYQGKAKAFKDPDDGTWKVVGPFEHLGVTVSDQENYGISESLKTKYAPFVFEYTTTGGSNGVASTGSAGGSSASSGSVGPSGNTSVTAGLTPVGTMASIINGNWSGDIAQDGVKKPYAVTASWDVAKNLFVISYPQYGCSGTWTIENSLDKILTLREHIQKGRCVDGGSVKLFLLNDTVLQYVYIKPGATKGDAYGRLKK